jgi:hypothetical protein
MRCRPPRKRADAKHWLQPAAGDPQSPKAFLFNEVLRHYMRVVAGIWQVSDS